MHTAYQYALVQGKRVLVVYVTTCYLRPHTIRAKYSRERHNLNHAIYEISQAVSKFNPNYA